MKSGGALMADNRIDFIKINILPGALFGPIGHFECVLCCQQEADDRAHPAKLSRGTPHDKEVFFCEAREAFLTSSPGSDPSILELVGPRRPAPSGNDRSDVNPVGPTLHTHAPVSRMTEYARQTSSN